MPDPVTLIIYLAIIVIFIVVVWFLLTQLNLPEPVGKIIMIVLVVFIAAIAIGFLYSFAGHAPRLR